MGPRRDLSPSRRGTGVKKSGSAKATNTNRQAATSFSTQSSSSSSVNQADLIARIISSLQPQIQSAVSSALSGPVRTSLVEQPRVSAVSNNLEGTFGVGGTSVNIATPEFEIAY